jgi:hypothetical protein
MRGTCRFGILAHCQAVAALLGFNLGLGSTAAVQAQGVESK